MGNDVSLTERKRLEVGKAPFGKGGLGDEAGEGKPVPKSMGFPEN